MSNIIINNNNSTSNGNPAKTKTTTTVPAKFKYMIWNPAFLTEKPFQILIPIPKSAADQRATNVDFEEGPEEVVTDAREVGFESKSGLESGKSGLKFGFNLDRHGFVYVRGHRSCLYAGRDDADGKRLFYDPAVVNARYLPECVDLVRRVLGIEGRDRDQDQGRVELFGWRVSFFLAFSFSFSPSFSFFSFSFPSFLSALSIFLLSEIDRRTVSGENEDVCYLAVDC